MRWVWLILGILLVASGVLWTLQGLDLLGQSGGMNGEKIWAIIGPITAIIGLLLLARGVRRKPSA
ncbi:hypothetical protein Rhe02_85800 [Rhizocola hellebori]|uniref:Uncharacterized protein n=1 Tax=Rhizocola hellebori TaxID=1392758 RepID=A0A8J3VLU4_9ACTN|nr:hypothetical protein [Rhizocola hellebori]GIH10513.1 hypothetical protein Rhe02_85800 [Rhizocola hellebori]